MFQAFKIPTGSMEKNLLIGDHLIVNKMVFAPTATALERAHAAGARRSAAATSSSSSIPVEPERDFIKRVIGLPGRARSSCGARRSTSTASRSTSRTCTSSSRRRRTARRERDDVREEYGPVTVPAGQYFMMGDNRDNSEDSRYWGFLPASYVKGQALFIYFSFKENGSLPTFFSDVQWGRLLNRVK